MSMSKGYTLMEMMVVCALASIMMGTAVANLKGLNNPSLSAAAMYRSYLKEVRAKAIARTAAYMVVPNSSDGLTASFSDRCSDSFVSFVGDPKLDFQLPSGASFLNTSWTICITSRGLASNTVTVTILGNDGDSKQVELMLGGATREL